MRMLVAVALLWCACSPAPDPKTADPGDQGVEGWEPVFAPVPDRAPCSDAKLAQVLGEGGPVEVNCNLTLGPADVVTRPLVIAGERDSGIRIDCNGATISGSPGDALRIHSQPAEPVHDVTISGCSVAGSVRVWGMATNGNGAGLLESSQTLQHAHQARDLAPYGITLSGLTITGTGRIPLYLAPGVHHVTVEDTTIGGLSESVMVYLDAESTANVLRRVTIHAEDASREAIAVDGSSGNTFQNLAIWSAYGGGVYFYRNCGEAGVIRHATPSSNLIAGLTVQCRRHRLDLHSGPALWFGSRDGRRSYCDDDAGWPYGSSVSDYDHARWNTVTGADLRDCYIEHGNATNHHNAVNP